MFKFDIRARLYSVVALSAVGLIVLSAILINMQTDNVPRAASSRNSRG